MVTGSTLGDAAGFNGLSSRRALYDNVHFGKSLPPTSVEVQKAMSRGTTNERNAVATICTKVLPVFFPQLDFVEVGSLEIHHIHPLILMLMENVPVSLIPKSFLCFPLMVFLFQGNPLSWN